MAHTLQERYSNLVLAKLRQENVFANLFNRKYEGSPKAGAVKIPVRDTEATVGTYSTATGKVLTVGATTYQTLNINEDIAVNEIVDGYEASAVPDGLIADRLDSAGYALALSIDTALATLLTTSGNYTAATSTATDEYELVVDAITQAKKAKVNKASMWIVASADFIANLEKNTNFIHASAGGDDVIRNGFAGKINGVPVYESLSTVVDSYKFILGNSDFCHFVNEFSVPVTVKDLTNEYIGSSAVQGRMVYGCKVSRPTTVILQA